MLVFKLESLANEVPGLPAFLLHQDAETPSTQIAPSLVFLQVLRRTEALDDAVEVRRAPGLRVRDGGKDVVDGLAGDGTRLVLPLRNRRGHEVLLGIEHTWPSSRILVPPALAS